VDAAFIFLMVVLKIPIAALLYIVWWAIRATPETDVGAGRDDGGTKAPRPAQPRHPRDRRPNPRRRGPHGAPVCAPPARTRSLVARGRRVPS
jgi:hypothetical protein